MGSYVPSTAREREEMLRAIGLERMDDLFRDVPEQVRRAASLRLPEGLSEMALRARMEALAAKNRVFPIVLRGAGAMRLFMVTTFSDLILRVGFSVLLFRFWQELGIWLSWPIGWLLGTGISFWFYRSGLWKKNLPEL